MFYLVVIPIIILVAPWLVTHYVFATARSRTLPYTAFMIYPWLAGLLWIISFSVPSLPVSDQTTTFSQHLGGGVIAALLFIYAIKAYGLMFRRWWQSLVVLYFFVSGLGVANELFEFALTATGRWWIDGSDVWWDLLANTLGALGAWLIWFGLQQLRRLF